MSDQAIETLFEEDRRYPPPPEFAAHANAKPEIYDIPFEEFWEREGRERVTWFEPFTSLLEWELPYAKWYGGGKINVAYNCLDRHVEAGLGDRVAFYYEGEPTGDDAERAAITYEQLLDEVVRAANGLKALGVGKGTPVGIYMGMGPGLPVAMLACARLGAPHTVVFGGFSAESLADRLNDMRCEVLLTQDESYRRGTIVPLKRNADDALASCPGLRSVVVGQRTRGDVPMTPGRDITWNELVEGQSTDPASCPCEPMDAEDLLYLLYTSGTTAKPKGIAHTTAGYLVGVASTHHYIFDLKPGLDVYWCAADIGWVTGHSYIVYGPLCNGATSVLYEGTPDFPDKDRWWEIVERYKVTILYTAPTAIRAHMKWGPEHAAKHDLSSLRLLGTVGEPINPEAWMWYREHIGSDRTPIVDTWWQTETGMVLITPLPGVTTTKPGSATKPFPGIDAGVVDDQRQRRRPRWRRLPRAEAAVARNDARDLRRRRAFPVDVLGALPGDVLRRRRRAHRRGRRLLAPRPRRRRHERLGPPHLDDRGRVRARRPPERRRGGGVRTLRFVDRSGDRRVRDAERRRGGLRRAARGTPQPRRREDRPDREAGEHRLHGGAPEDALGEDHAAAAARRRREPAAGRHDDSCGSRGRRRDRRPRRRPADRGVATQVDTSRGSRCCLRGPGR